VQIEATRIAGVFVVRTEFVRDHRGQFGRLFCRDELSAILGAREIIQINASRTSMRGAVRGLHYQRAPHAEMKLVRCVRGRVWDVAVDLRAGSETFLQWHAEELSADSGKMLVVPEGCAHGFQVLDAESEMLYLHTARYEPSSEGGVKFDDPRLGIAWPLSVCDLSARDSQHPALVSDFSGLH
jgi:dTDP-4-dehydrorhamnose 3,5-epimerase